MFKDMQDRITLFWLQRSPREKSAIFWGGLISVIVGVLLII